VDIVKTRPELVATLLDGALSLDEVGRWGAIRKVKLSAIAAR
jgi:hypothetical protein